MNRIKLMETDLSNKIAAGEVVESIHSVVKELVENSIDAEASQIKVNLLETGLKEIKVVDNGTGMSMVDAKMSLLRHATSKLITLDDLWHIGTLGFRGEALPSIASVSSVEMITSDGKDSVVLVIENGEIQKETKGAMRKGTQITVKNLFYNTPARLKHLKSLQRELADVSNYVNQMALAYPNIKWELTNDDKTLLNTDGKGNLQRVINDIYGSQVVKKMLDISGENSDYFVSGYASLPELYRSSRNFITIIVNGRVVRSNDVIKSVLEAYHTYLPEGKIPIVVLNIEVDPTLIDINIHPTKKEIKFSKQDVLKELIFDVIRVRLNKELLIPEVNQSFIAEGETTSYDNTYQLTMETMTNDKANNIKINKLPPLMVKGFVKGTYIVAENADAMYLIDQHAANERINYEKYLNALGNPANESVQLLLPITIELTTPEYIMLQQNFLALEKIGIIFKEFGANTIVVTAHPNWLPTGYEADAIKKIIDVIIAKEERFDISKFNEKIAIMTSCKLSIKANERISVNEAEQLIERLSQTKNPYTCPHGRPVVISFTNYELEKMFKRTM